MREGLQDLLIDYQVRIIIIFFKKKMYPTISSKNKKLVSEQSYVISKRTSTYRKNVFFLTPSTKRRTIGD